MIAGTESISHEVFIDEGCALPPLTREQEQDLAVRIEAGDDQAVETLVLHNIRFAVMMAQRMYPGRVPFEDLTQDAVMGLIIAARKFRPGDTKFCSFARWQVMSSIQQGSRRHIPPVSIPNHAHKFFAPVKAFVSQYAGQHGGVMPTPAEISEALDIPEFRAEQSITAIATHHALDGVPEHESPRDYFTSKYNIPSKDVTDGEAVDESDADYARWLADVDDERLSRALIVRFGLDGGDPYLDRVGAELGVCRERARQLTNKALEAVRKRAIEDGRGECLMRMGAAS